MPALNKAKEQAKATVCLSNTKSLSLAWMMYANENESRIVGANTSTIADPEFSWVCGPQDINGTLINVYTGSTVEEKLNGIRRGLLWEYLENIEVYQCPSDKRYKSPPADPAHGGVGGFRSYSIPIGMNSYIANSYSWVIEPVKMTESIRSPSEKYVFIEEMDGRGYNLGAWALYPKGCAEEDQWVDPIAIWHNDSSILGFADGHSERHTWLEDTTIDMAQKQQIFYSAPGSRDLRYMQRGYIPGRR